MTLLLLFRGRVGGGSTPSAAPPTKYLRYDDRALWWFIHDELVKSKHMHVDVIDGYPIHKKLSVPCIAIEHNYTKENHVELGGDFKEMDREYTVDVFARTKGERDDLSSFLGGLLGLSMVTDDGRENHIYHISHDGNIDRSNWLVTEHGNYYRIYLDGSLGYGHMAHDAAFITNALTIDIDTLILEAPSDGERFYIFDKYLESNDQGFRFYVDNTGGSITLNFDFGIADAAFHYPIDFAEYIDERVQISATFRFTGTAVEIAFYLNGGDPVAYSYIPWFLSVNTGAKDIYMGAKYDDGTGNIGSNGPMYIYALRISNAYETNFGKVGEYLKPNTDNDLAYLPCNEGKFSTCYDHGSAPLRNMSLVQADWDLYLREITKRSKFYQSVNRFKLRGLRNLNIA